MNITTFFAKTLQKLPLLAPQILRQPVTAMFHGFVKQPNTTLTNIRPSQLTFLQPVLPNLTLNCGFKVKGKLRRRCKDCYFVRRQERLYIICKTHPRHKQMSMVKREKSTWLLSHAMQSKLRPY